MANRYWVGGADNWNGTAGSKWSTTDGGAGGSAIPASTDDVFFTSKPAPTWVANTAYILTNIVSPVTGNGFYYECTTAGTTGASEPTWPTVVGNTVTDGTAVWTCRASTVTVATGNTGAKSLNFTGYAGTFAGTAAITISGSITLASGMTYTHSGTITVNATGTITSSGKTVTSSITVSGSGITITLGDALNAVGSSNVFQLTQGTINLNNFNLSCIAFQSSNSNTRTIAFGTGNITCTGSGNAWACTTTTNMTTTGTPVVNITNSGATATTVAAGSLNESNAISFNFTAGTYTLTFLGVTGNTAKNVNFSGFTGTWTTGSATTHTIYGNLTLGAGMSNPSSTQSATFGGTSGTNLLTFNGVSFLKNTIFDGVGGTWKFVDAANFSTRTITLTNGTLDTNGQTVTAGSISSSNSNTRVLTLGASTVNLSGTAPLVFTTKTNLTLNADTSQINCSSATALSFDGNGLTFYDVAFTGAAGVTHTVTGSNTFNSLSLTPSATAGILQCTFAANQTISGTITAAGSSSVQRIFLRSDTAGTVRTLTAATLSATDCDFRDITIAGGAAGSSPTRAGNCGGNTGVTFPVAKTVYWNLAGTQNWSATGWATGSNGTPDINNFPLAQDTVIFDNAGSASTVTFEAAWNVGTVNLSARTNPVTLSVQALIVVYGSWTSGSQTSYTTGVTTTFGGRTTQTITNNGRTFLTNVTVDNVTGTVILADAFTTSSVTLTSGTFDAANFNVTLAILSSSNSNVRTLTFGTGTWTFATSSSTPVTFTTTTNLTFNSTNCSILINNASSPTIFASGGLTYAGTITKVGTGTLRFTESPTINTLTMGSTGSMPAANTAAFQIASGTTLTVSNLTNVRGRAVLFSSSVAGSSATLALSSGSLSPRYFIFKDIAFTGSWTTSIFNFCLDGGNNTGVSFEPAYYYIATGDAWGTTGNWSNTAGGVSNGATPTGTTNVVLEPNTTAGTGQKFLTIPASTSVKSFVVVSRSTSWSISGNSLDIAANLCVGSSPVGFLNTISAPLNLSATTSGNIIDAGPTTAVISGITISGGVTFNGAGGDWKLLSRVALSGITSMTLTNGTLDLNGFLLSLSGSSAGFVTAAGTKNITFNGGTLSIIGAGATAFNNAAPTGFTTTAGTGTGILQFSSASAKTFVGGGSTYNCTLRNSGAGALTITGSNTITTLENTIQPTSFLFTAETTTVITTWSVSGTAGNLVTIGSDTAAQHTLSVASGTVSANYLNISQSIATGGARWNAGRNSVNGGNNIGWFFPTEVDFFQLFY